MSKNNKMWIIKTTIITFFLAIIFSVISESLVRNVSVFFAFILLFIIIFLGVFFDTIGIAVAAADEKPFHSMASAKVESAKYSIKLIKNASKVANFCNDVVGDIAGIISGSTVGIIIGVMSQGQSVGGKEAFISVLFSGLVASMTVGGKAIGKEVAISHSKEIVDYVGKILHFFDRKNKPKKSTKIKVKNMDKIKKEQKNKT